MSALKRFLNDENGATAIEYGLIAALVAGAGYALMYLSADTDRDRRLRW